MLYNNFMEPGGIFKIVVASIFIFLFAYYFNRILNDFDEIDFKKLSIMIEKEKDINDLIKYVDSKLKKYPDNGLLYYYKARALFMLKDYKNALYFLDSSIALGFPLFDSYVLKSLIYSELKDYNKQLEFANKAIETDPTDPQGYILRARAYFNLKNYSLSLEDLNVSYNIGKDDNLLIEKAVVLLKMEKFVPAINLLYELNKKYADNKIILYNLFLCYKAIGYYNNALYVISRLYEIYKDPIYLKEKSTLLYEMGDYISSLFEFKKYLSHTRQHSLKEEEFYKLLITKNLIYH